MLAPEKSFWQVPVPELMRDLSVASSIAKTGLDRREAADRTARYGANRLETAGNISFLRKFLSGFLNPLVIVLLFAATVSAATGDSSSFAIICFVVLLSIVLDSVQEYRAQKAANELRLSVALNEQVLRDGGVEILSATELVPGDVVLLAAGDLVPADGVLLEARDFFVNEALLTGESYPSEKVISSEGLATASLAEAKNAVFMGTSVISGSARLLVCATGKRTQLGAISKTLRRPAPPAALERGIHRFGLLIMRVTALLVLFVLLANLLFHRPLLESFVFALALAVG